MAVEKISDFPSATALTGTELIPVLQGGINATATAQDIADLAAATPADDYKVYVAYITSNNGIITSTVLKNTIGDGSNDGINDILWTNPSNGVLRATMTAAPFVSAKSICFNGGVSSYFTPTTFPTTSFMKVDLIYHDGTQASTPNFTKMSVEIRVYN